MADLTVHVETGKTLICRVIFLAQKDNKMLCMKGKHFSFLPGGRIQFDEPSNQAVIREAKEELGIDIDTTQLCGLLENFFYDKYEKYKVQELCFFYRISLPENFIPPEFEPCGRRNEWEWISIDDWNDKCLPQLPHNDLEKIYYSDIFFHIINRD